MLVVVNLEPQRGGLRPAQGNALGTAIRGEEALKGRPNDDRLGRPFRASTKRGRFPRALPLGSNSPPRWGSRMDEPRMQQPEDPFKLRKRR